MYSTYHKIRIEAMSLTLQSEWRMFNVSINGGGTGSAMVIGVRKFIVHIYSYS
jgi:hypothetical protein